MACCAVFFCSCNRSETHYYEATAQEFFANPTNQISVDAVLGTIDSYWVGDDAFKGLSVENADAKAIAKFDVSLTALRLHLNELKPYFDENDKIIYSLNRTTPGDQELGLRVYEITQEGISIFENDSLKLIYR